KSAAKDDIIRFTGEGDRDLLPYSESSISVPRPLLAAFSARPLLAAFWIPGARVFMVSGILPSIPDHPQGCAHVAHGIGHARVPGRPAFHQRGMVRDKDTLVAVLFQDAENLHNVNVPF